MFYTDKLILTHNRIYHETVLIIIYHNKPANESGVLPEMNFCNILIFKNLNNYSMMKHILVPYDFSNFGDLAFEKAVEIGKKFESKITLLTVITTVDTSGMNWTRAQEYQDENEKKVKGELDRIVNKNPYGVDISVKIIHEPSTIKGIVNFAKNNKTDLIVMGSHGRSGFKKLVLGSVAAGVLVETECPVLTVKPKKQ